MTTLLYPAIAAIILAVVLWCFSVVGYREIPQEGNKNQRKTIHSGIKRFFHFSKYTFMIYLLSFSVIAVLFLLLERTYQLYLSHYFVLIPCAGFIAEFLISFGFLLLLQLSAYCFARFWWKRKK